MLVLWISILVSYHWMFLVSGAKSPEIKEEGDSALETLTEASGSYRFSERFPDYLDILSLYLSSDEEERRPFENLFYNG